MTPPGAPPRPDAPVFRPVADRAVLVEFGDTISDAAHDQVLRLDRALAARPFAGFAEAVPAFVNLLVLFDPGQTDHATTTAALRALLTTAPETLASPTRHQVPVCYENAPDLAQVAARCGLTQDAVINAHLAGAYQVFLYGFAPGYAYLAGLPPALRLDRKPAPVRGVAAGSVIIAGAQCLVTTLTMPTGWWRIGRSPSRILTGDPARPFLFDVGDAVQFRRISAAEFDRLHHG